ncbi:hypothetical protein EUTSA_v10029269mg [Eutrema salsugineum]|uniref:protein-serine/threonine phosphatase n=1 Tax=Eutrema salsugineum TaxID=72664 RepID=V4LFY5_EUTSA|nr:hypothetical protein EUTSA_v10029269mg [Eutrema salsugineum]
MAFTKHLTTKISTLFKKNKRRNKPACLNKEKKLHLVLDLDHTLLHTILVSQLTQKEKYLIEEVDSRVDLWRFDKGLPNEYFIKLRPFVREFLQEANKLFSLYVYTMGSYSYAQTVLNLIDPGRVYFGNRVITREKSPFKKTLDLLVVDKRRVRNLLEITKYMYFRDEKKSKSYAEKERDESRSNGPLANILRLLKKAHRRFEEELDSKDLRLLIRDPCRQCCF